MNYPEQFLHQKNPKLHISKPVEHEQVRKKRKGEQVSQKPAEKIANFMEVLKQTHLNHKDDPRVLERIKNHYHQEYVIKKEDIPESYFDNQKRLAREQGHGDIEITDDMREQLTEIIKSDQISTLDKWLDYFTSEDSDSYPMWAKYWAFTNMIKLSSYDKEKHSFGKRDKGTIAPFPDLNREALAYVIDAVVKKVGKEKFDSGIQADKEFQKLLQGANFGKLYAWAIEKVTPTEENELLQTDGKWIKYDQGSDHMPLVKSLQGHGTGWCTAGESTAEAQLQGGDFYVYYSYDKNNQPIIPRVAIRMEENHIAEVRGIAQEQNLDPYIGEVLDEKLAEFGSEGEAYQKKSADMKKLTAIDKKNQLGQKLSKNELKFLYEIDSNIEGFGYQRDPQIQEIIQTRNIKEDAPIVFDCGPEKIAWKKEEVNENTRVYIGEWNIEIFQTIRNYPNITYLYESFLDKKIFMQNLETDSNIDSPQKAKQALKEKNIYLSDWGKDILEKTKFSKDSQSYNLVRFTVGELGLLNGSTTEEIFQKAQELGLELCPAEVGPHLRLQYLGKEWMLMAMKQISDRFSDPSIFRLGRIGGQLGLDGYDATSSNEWGSDYEFVFRYRKLEV